MSPLARSLLTLTALLSVAIALHTPPNCAEKDVGYTGDYPPIVLDTVFVTYPGGNVEVDAETTCNLTYGHSYGCGLHILACNKDPNGMPPTIEDVNKQTLTPVPIDCADTNGDDVTIWVNCCSK